MADKPVFDAVLTPAEVAAMFHVDPKTVTRWAEAGKLSFIRTLGGPLVGLGLGALVRNQVAAIIAAVVWVQLVEGIATVPRVGQWLPAGAVRAITRSTSAFGPGELDTLPAWDGVLLLAGWGVEDGLIRSFRLRDGRGTWTLAS